MPERIIRNLGDPILRVKCKRISTVTPVIARLLDDMIETLYASEGRAGLAAPQIGIAKRINVLDYDNSGLIEFINPEIVERSGEQYAWEGCLSIPGYYGKVKRAQYVKVRSFNRAGEDVFYEGEGKLAVCMQHEIDHLDGILYIDHVEPGQLFSESNNKPVDIWSIIALSKRNDGLRPSC